MFERECRDPYVVVGRTILECSVLIAGLKSQLKASRPHAASCKEIAAQRQALGFSHEHMSLE